MSTKGVPISLGWKTSWLQGFTQTWGVFTTMQLVPKMSVSETVFINMTLLCEKYPHFNYFLFHALEIGTHSFTSVEVLKTRKASTKVFHRFPKLFSLR